MAALVLLDGVRWRDAPVAGERSHALLAALAADPSHAVGDARLVEDVWGDDRPAAPTKALQVLVSRTRAHTDPSVVERVASGYRLGTDDVDVVRQREALAAATAALAAGDLETARDRAREALAHPVSAGTTDGVLGALRQEARRRADRAAVLLGRALSALGEHEEALGLLEPAVVDRPDDEVLLEAALRSEAAVRGAPAALARYERHRSAVRDGLGTDPGPALQRLHAELLAADRPVRSGLHHDATRLVGRDDDVAALRRLVRTDRLTSLLGPGGLGKTRLAHVVGRLADQPVVHFVELAGVRSPEGVAVEVGSAIGIRETATGRLLQGSAQRHDLHARIVEQLGGVPSLLILDNCEHVVEAVADLVAVLLARTGRLHVLTTTRAPLGLAGERVYPLGQLGTEDAVALFRERATAARPGVRLDDERVAGLVERLDGLPLAIELAAAQVRVMSVEEIERRLQDRFALLRGGGRQLPARHQTLQAVIDWSWNLLAEPERAALRRLAVFRDGFSAEGAAAVVGVTDAIDVLTRLVDQSLVTVHEGDGPLRFRLLETVREFGRLRLVEADDEEATEQRLRDWATGFALTSVERLFGPHQVEAMGEVRVEEGNLTDLLRRALERRDALTVLVLMGTLSGFWTVEGNHLKVVNVAASVQDVVLDADFPPQAEPLLRGVLAVLVTHTMIFAQTSDAAALRRLRALGPGEPGRIGAWVTVLLRLSEAESFGQVHVLDDLCADPDPQVALLALQWSSQAHENAGDMAGALAAATGALALCDDRDGPWMRALLMSQLAGLAMQSGDIEAARAYAADAVPPMRALGASGDLVQLESLLAVCEIKAGRLDRAEQLLAGVEADERNNNAVEGAMAVLCGRAEIALARGETEAGLRLYRDAVDQLSDRGLPGVDVLGGYEPWVVYPESGALAAHSWLRHPASPALRADLLAKAEGFLGRGPAFLDYPMTGAVLFALAVWELVGREPTGGDESTATAVRLLVLAETCAFNRLLPSLDWDRAAAAADARRPGLLEEVRGGYAGRTPHELRDEIGALVASLR